MLRSAAEELSKAEAQSGDDPVTRPISRGGSAGRILDPSSAGSGLDDAPLVTRSRPGSASKWGGARQRSGGVGADDWSDRRLGRGVRASGAGVVVSGEELFHMFSNKKIYRTEIRDKAKGLYCQAV